jgi:transposase
MSWAVPPVARDQLALFETSLDEVIPEDHLVRVLDEILRALDWREFEAKYHGTLGARPVHPRVLASIILYGHLTRVRSSRQLEAALWCRVDFRWLAEGEPLDHSTISIFRKQFAELLLGINTQFGLLAHQMGVTTLTQFGFDGTRLRASNARSRKVAVDKLDELEQELQKTFAELEQQVANADALDEEQLGGASLNRVPAELRKTENRLKAVRRAKAEIERVKAAKEPVPERIPLTDPESRISPNKEGGFAPNYTPLSAVDLESGLILDGDVIQNTDEEQHLVASLEAIESRFAAAGLTQHVESLAADGLFVTGPNLEALAERKTTFYGPIAAQPEIVKRADGRMPIPTEQWPQLPMVVVRKGKAGQPDQVQLAKEAFLYDAAENCYWCPQGQPLSHIGQTSETTRGTERRVIRQRYRAEATACESCPLRDKCLQAQGTQRTLSHDQYEEHRNALRERLTAESSSDQLTRRQSEGERPFAVVKQQMGIRQFLLRGHENVNKEWRWMTSSANTQVIIRWWRANRDRLPNLLANFVGFLKSTRPKGARISPTEVGA